MLIKCCFCGEHVNQMIQPWNYFFPSTVFHIGCNIMFKDSKDGQTHYQDDGCGEPAHNCKTKYCKHYESDFDRFIKASKEEKKKLLEQVVDEANEDQMKIGINIGRSLIKDNENFNRYSYLR